MSHTRRVVIILAIIFGTPLFGLMIGVLAQKFLAPEDTSGLLNGFAMLVGIFGALGSLVFGPIVSFIMRKSQNQLHSLLGYIVPSLLAIIYVIWLAFLA